MKIENIEANQLNEKLICEIKGMMDDGYKEHPFPREVSADGFVKGIKPLLGNGMGCVFVLKTDRDEFAGAIVGVVYPDFLSSVLMATEIMWRVNELGKGYGYLLYECFEGWANRKGAKRILMAVMNDKNEKKISHFYLKRFYRYYGKQFVKEV